MFCFFFKKKKYSNVPIWNGLKIQKSYKTVGCLGFWTCCLYHDETGLVQPANLCVAEKCVQESVAIQRTVIQRTTNSCFKMNQKIREQRMVKLEVVVRFCNVCFKEKKKKGKTTKNWSLHLFCANAFPPSPPGKAAVRQGPGIPQWFDGRVTGFATEMESRTLPLSPRFGT